MAENELTPTPLRLAITVCIGLRGLIVGMLTTRART